MTDSKSLLGTWYLRSMTTEFDDGTLILPYGARAMGRIHYADDGFMAAHLWDPGRHVKGPKDTNPDPAYFSYTGVYRIEGNQVIHTVVAATPASWTGVDKLRTIKWVGEDVELTADVIFEGKLGRGVLRWGRENAT